MTHASDLAKLAETFIDRYLVECDARREAEAALAKSEEERATQSANLAASLAECERLKADRAEWERRYVEADRARGEAEAKAHDLHVALVGAQAEERENARTIKEQAEKIDALRRAEAGKGAGDDGEADALELATTFHNAVAALDYRIARFADCNYRDRNRLISAAKQTFAAVVRPRLAALQAKVDALTVERDEKDADLKAALTALDEAKAAGEGRVVGEPVWKPVDKHGVDGPAEEWAGYNGHVLHAWSNGTWMASRQGSDMNTRGDLASAKHAAASFALSLNGATLAKTHAHLAERDRCFGCGDSSPAVRCSLCATCAEAVTGRTLAQPADAEAKRKAALEAVGDFVYGHARRISEQHDGCTDDETVRDFAVEVHDILNNLRADENAEVYDGRPGRASSSGPTSPAKPADRYVVVGRDKVAGRPAEFYAFKSTADANAADYNSGHDDRDGGPGPFDPSAAPLRDGAAWAVVDTQPVTAPQPSPRAVDVDAERLAELHADITAEIDPESEDGVRWYRWRELTAKDHATATEAMRRALATIGAQPVVALNEEMLADAMARCPSWATMRADKIRERAGELIDALGPVAIHAGIDRTGLAWARGMVEDFRQRHPSSDSVPRALAAIDATLAGQPGAVTVDAARVRAIAVDLDDENISTAQAVKQLRALVDAEGVKP